MVITVTGTEMLENTNAQSGAATKEIGDSVDYTTTLNGETLDNWKVFYVDGNYTYIILDDYLPNAYISNSIIQTHNLDTRETYGIYTDAGRQNLINAMTTKQNWASLLAGTINEGKANEHVIDYSDLTDSNNIYAMGAPPVDLWVDSWNISNSTELLSTSETATQMSDGLKGYYISNSSNLTTSAINISSTTGYLEAEEGDVYFPYKDPIDCEECYGYWLANPSARDVTDVMSVGYGGGISGNMADVGVYAFRPIIRLPSSDLN